MMFTCLIPMLFSVLILAAHFLRTGPMILVILCLTVPLTLFIRRIWALRLVIILGAVAAFTAGAAFILQAKKVRDHYGAAPGAAPTRR